MEPRATNRRRSALSVRRLGTALQIALAVGLPLAGLSGQEGGPVEPPPQLLNVFLDCHLVLSCDTDHFRREITFVNWVRRREDAHVHLILTYTPSGAGNEYQLDDIGPGRLQGQGSPRTEKDGARRP